MRCLPLLALAGIACSDPNPGETDATNPPPTGTNDPSENYSDVATSDGGSWSVQYAANPDPIPLDDYFSISLSVFDGADGTTPATGVTVGFDAGMPEHGHGMTVTPTITDNGDGTWLVDGLLFHMEGHWQMIAKVTDTAGLQSATFDTDCCQ